MKWRLYRLVMKLAHRFHWHYAPPSYPEGDTLLWCQWCGFRQIVKRHDYKPTTPGRQKWCILSIQMRRLLVAVCLFSATLMSAKVRHIDGLLDVEWKQKGSQPISLTIYDETMSAEWPAVIEDAVTLWDASTAFQLAYVRGPAPTDYPPRTGTVRVIERVNPHDQGFTIPSAQGIVTWWTVELNPPSLITTANGWTVAQVMEREARHELGHVLTLDHHNITFLNAPWGGGAEPDCTMANGYQVTGFDLGLLCQRYGCR